MAKKIAKTQSGVPVVGKSRGKRKLTDEQVLNIVASYVPRKVTLKSFAEKYGVSLATISSIVKGRSYSWLTGIAPPMAMAA